MAHIYRGSCHCQDHIFFVSLPAALTEATVDLCSCSWCAKRGLVWANVEKEGFTFEKGGEGLRSYIFGQKRLDNKSCARCGTFLFSTRSDEKDPEFNKISFNVRAIPGFNLWDMKLNTDTQYDDALPAFHPPQPLLDLPFSQIPSDHKVYNGSCHCGDVQFAIESEPLEKRTDGCDCSCSICSMNGVLWIYPLLTSFHLPETFRSSLTTYSFSDRPLPQRSRFYFCKRCSCLVYAYRDYTAEGNKRVDLGLNARLLDVVGSDGKWKGMGEIKFDRFDGWNEGWSKDAGYKLPEPTSL